MTQKAKLDHAIVDLHLKELKNEAIYQLKKSFDLSMLQRKSICATRMRVEVSSMEKRDITAAQFVIKFDVSGEDLPSLIWLLSLLAMGATLMFWYNDQSISMNMIQYRIDLTKYLLHF